MLCLQLYYFLQFFIVQDVQLYSVEGLAIAKEQNPPAANRPEE